MVVTIFGLCPGLLSQNTLLKDIKSTGDTSQNKSAYEARKIVNNRYDTLRSYMLKPFMDKSFNDFDKTENIFSFSKKITASALTPVSDLKNELKRSLDQLYKKPFELKNIKFSTIGQGTSQRYDTLGYSNFRNSNFTMSMLASGIPLDISYTHLQIDGLPTSSEGKYSFQFDKDGYIESLKKKVAGKFSPEEMLGNMFQSIDSLKQIASSRLSLELKAIGERYKGQLDNEIKSIGDPSKFIEQGMMPVQHLLDASLTSVSKSDQQTIYQQLIDQRNLGLKVDSNLLNNVEQSRSKNKGMEEMALKVKEHYLQWQQSGLIQSLHKLELMKKEKILQIAGDPDIIKKVAKSKLNLSGIQKMFLNIEKMNAGQNVVSQSPLSLNGFLNNGFSTDFLKNNKFLSGTIGLKKAMPNIFDQGFTNSIFNSGFRAISFSAGKGASESTHSRFTVTSFQQQDVSTGFGFIPYMVPRNTAVTTFSKELSMGGSGHLNLDISKSSSQYTREINPDSSAVSKSSFGNLFSGENFMNNVAIAADYTGEIQDIDLQHRVMVKWAADRYFNPGIHSMPGGTKEILADVKKSFLKKQLQVRARTNIRQYDLSAGTGSKYNHFNSLIDIRWKLKKGKYLSVRYMPSRGNRKLDGVTTLGNKTDRLSADFNLNYRFRNTYYRNYLSLSHQGNEYQYLSGERMKSKSWTISSMQNITIGRQLVYWNLNYTSVNEASQFIFFNSSLNSDLGLSYSIGKYLSASSSVNYNGIKGWYSQLGIRQNISGQIGKRIQMSLYIDAGKNIKVYQQLPYNNTFRADWSLLYQLK